MNELAAVTFRLPGGLVPGAQRVSVVGPFNGWNHMVHTMSRRTGADWAVTIYLPPGRVIYLFDVDGGFWLDPDDDERMPNAWGSEYSVRHVATPAAGAEAAQRRGARTGRENESTEESVGATGAPSPARRTFDIVTRCLRGAARGVYDGQRAQSDR